MHAISLHGVSYAHPDDTPVFTNVSLKLELGRYGLLGPNGSGKTTLIRLLAGELQPNSGTISCNGTWSYLSQIDRLDDTTTIEECFTGFHRYEIEQVLERFATPFNDLTRQLGTLSGGERIRLRIARACIDDPTWLFLDEPSNHLDMEGRRLLYQLLETWDKGLFVISHDRELLERVDTILELSNLGLRRYGGTYSFYRSQREREDTAVATMITNRESALQRELRTRRRELDKISHKSAEGRKRAERTNLPKALRGAQQRHAESTAGKRRAVANDRIAQASEAYERVRTQERREMQVHFDIPNSAVPQGKIVFSETGISLEIIGPERIAVLGRNGSGKTTLLRHLANRARVPAAYLDQRLEMLPTCGTLADAMREIAPLLAEHERRIHVGRLGFVQERTLAPIAHLSGGERMRAALALLFASSHPPQLLLLDEPETHLDLQSLEQLEEALLGYRGALVVVSHDHQFLEALETEREIILGVDRIGEPLEEMPSSRG